MRPYGPPGPTLDMNARHVPGSSSVREVTAPTSHSAHAYPPERRGSFAGETGPGSIQGRLGAQMRTRCPPAPRSCPLPAPAASVDCRSGTRYQVARPAADAGIPAVHLGSAPICRRNRLTRAAPAHLTAGGLQRVLRKSLNRLQGLANVLPGRRVIDYAHTQREFSVERSG